MGYCYDKLIAPALLYLNPGMTREEFADLLDRQHSSGWTEYKRDDPWNSHEDRLPMTCYERIDKLAQTLGLPHSKDFQQFLRPRYEMEIRIDAPYMDRPPESEKGYRIVGTKELELGEPVTVTNLSFSELTEGSVWQDPLVGEKLGLVTRILKSRKLPILDDAPNFEYTFEMKPIRFVPVSERFETEEALYQKWPQFHPYNKYDWSRDEGEFSVDSFSKGFLWLKKGDRYFFDPRTLEKIPASFRAGGYLAFGYTDLVLTMEAVKNHAWKLLSRRGLDHLQQFFHDFLEAKGNYERAVWDSFTSLYAAGQNMTVDEFLRMRLRMTAGSSLGVVAHF